MTTPCLHRLTVSPKVCDLCHLVVPGAARTAARLRGRHGDALTTVIPSRGESRLQLVRGDKMREVVLRTRERHEGDAATTPLVAEVLVGCRFSDGHEVKVGDVFPVAMAAGKVEAVGGEVPT